MPNGVSHTTGESAKYRCTHYSSLRSPPPRMQPLHAQRQQLTTSDPAHRRQVKLQDNLTAFPAELYQLADTLEVLDLSNNQLTSLPDDLTRFTKLRILFASNNPFTALPRVLGQMPQLDMVGFKA